MKFKKYYFSILSGIILNIVSISGCGWGIIDPPLCAGYNTIATHNIVSMDFFAGVLLQYSNNEIHVQENECDSNLVRISFGGQIPTGVDYLFYGVSWNLADCSGTSCNARVHVDQCGITLPYCQDRTPITENATIDANGDVNTFTEIVSPTFRLVPVR